MGVSPVVPHKRPVSDLLDVIRLQIWTTASPLPGLCQVELTHEIVPSHAEMMSVSAPDSQPGKEASLGPPGPWIQAGLGSRDLGFRRRKVSRAECQEAAQRTGILTVKDLDWA